MNFFFHFHPSRLLSLSLYLSLIHPIRTTINTLFSFFFLVIQQLLFFLSNHTMGLLNFRKKSKKNNAVKEDVASDIDSVASPMVQSLLTDTSDISKNLLEEIFSDLPTTSTKSFSGKLLLFKLFYITTVNICFLL